MRRPTSQTSRSFKRIGSSGLAGIAEGPNLIYLDTLCLDVANGRVLVFLTGFAYLHQRTQDNALRHASHARRGTDGTAFYQRCDDRRFCFAMLSTFAMSQVYDSAFA